MNYEIFSLRLLREILKKSDADKLISIASAQKMHYAREHGEDPEKYREYAHKWCGKVD